jgi:hypothetical protein
VERERLEALVRDLQTRLAKAESDLQLEAKWRRKFEGEAWALREEVKDLKLAHKNEVFALRDQLRAAQQRQKLGAGEGHPAQMLQMRVGQLPVNQMKIPIPAARGQG